MIDRRKLFTAIATFSAVVCAAVPAAAQDGFASKATGGVGGATVVVRTAEALRAAAMSPDPRIIRIVGSFPIGTVTVGSNKSLIGSGDSVLAGTLLLGGGTRNVIIQNLGLTNPMSGNGGGGGDGITVRGGKLIWIDHCTVFDCGDGCIDVTNGANDVTISWCKFSYTDQPSHRFVMLAIGPLKKRNGKKPTGFLNLTLHHNWFAEGCQSRMPAARRARIHSYNNYFTCRDNEYCTNGRRDSEILSRSNFYDGVRNPLYTEDDARLNSDGDTFRNCSGKLETRKDDVFGPPYPWKAGRARDVPATVRGGAGMRKE